MSSTKLPIESLPVWATLNDVRLNNARVGSLSGKGQGVLATEDLSSTEEAPVLVTVPHDVILCEDAIEGYAKADKRFRELLDAMGPQSTRVKALIFLLTQQIYSVLEPSGGGLSTPWTEYVRYLPDEVCVPTMWHDYERALLRGTSLESAVNAKLTELTREFDLFQEKSEPLPAWDDIWNKKALSLRDWILADALYRSRSLELPRSGHAMVPVVDMANHSSPAPNAIYEESDDRSVTLQLRPGSQVRSGDEITITYGEDKPAAEMLFSYGFIDPEDAKKQLVLPLNPFEDDPLIKAKLHAFQKPPMVHVSQDEGGVVSWSSPFAYFMCLNEEDGLEFRVLQTLDGSRQLRVFWREDDVTDRVGDFETLTREHPLGAVFRLRVVAVVEELVAEHVARMQAAASPEEEQELRDIHGDPREECARLAGALRTIESGVLEAASRALETEKTELLQNEAVVSYLTSAGGAQIEQVTAGKANEEDEDDFS